MRRWLYFCLTETYASGQDWIRPIVEDVDYGLCEPAGLKSMSRKTRAKWGWWVEQRRSCLSDPFPWTIREPVLQSHKKTL